MGLDEIYERYLLLYDRDPYIKLITVGDVVETLPEYDDHDYRVYLWSDRIDRVHNIFYTPN